MEVFYLDNNLDTHNISHISPSPAHISPSSTFMPTSPLWALAAGAAGCMLGAMGMAALTHVVSASITTACMSAKGITADLRAATRDVKETVELVGKMERSENVTRMREFITEPSDPPSTFQWNKTYGLVEDVRDVVFTLKELVESETIQEHLKHSIRQKQSLQHQHQHQRTGEAAGPTRALRRRKDTSSASSASGVRGRGSRDVVEGGESPGEGAEKQDSLTRAVELLLHVKHATENARHIATSLPQSLEHIKQTAHVFQPLHVAVASAAFFVLVGLAFMVISPWK